MNLLIKKIPRMKDEKVKCRKNESRVEGKEKENKKFSVAILNLTKFNTHKPPASTSTTAPKMLIECVV